MVSQGAHQQTAGSLPLDRISHGQTDLRRGGPVWKPNGMADAQDLLAASTRTDQDQSHVIMTVGGCEQVVLLTSAQTGFGRHEPPAPGLFGQQVETLDERLLVVHSQRTHRYAGPVAQDDLLLSAGCRGGHLSIMTATRDSS